MKHDILYYRNKAIFDVNVLWNSQAIKSNSWYPCLEHTGRNAEHITKSFLVENSNRFVVFMMKLCLKLCNDYVWKINHQLNQKEFLFKKNNYVFKE